MKRKILYITGTRADFGLMVSVLKSIKNHPNLELSLIVTGMHLMEEYGMTVQEIDGNDYQISTIPAVYDTSDASAIHFMASFFDKIGDMITKNRPDIILVAGDRAEMLAGAITATYLSIPLAHISGGDISSTVDEHIRHAITKLANIHFPYTEKSAARIIRMGEDPWRIHIVGAPGIDDIVKKPSVEKKEIAKKYNIDLNKPVALLLQHPVTHEIEDAPVQIEKTLQVLTEMNIQTIVVYPNADLGGNAMIEKIKQFEHSHNIHAYKSIPREDFLNLMRVISVLIGNSSSGILEAASFRLPVINIGSRQQGRERSFNVVDANYDKKSIKSMIEFVLYNQTFRDSLSSVVNPYGDGNTGEKIADILSNVVIDKKLLQKQLNYKI